MIPSCSLGKLGIIANLILGTNAQPILGVRERVLRSLYVVPDLVSSSCRRRTVAREQNIPVVLRLIGAWVWSINKVPYQVQDRALTFTLPASSLAPGTRSKSGGRRGQEFKLPSPFTWLKALSRPKETTRARQTCRREGRADAVTDAFASNFAQPRSREWPLFGKFRLAK